MRAESSLLAVDFGILLCSKKRKLVFKRLRKANGVVRSGRRNRRGEGAMALTVSFPEGRRAKTGDNGVLRRRQSVGRSVSR